MEAEVARDRKAALGTDVISYGRRIGRKRPRNRHLRDIATFCCPECGNKLREDLIRLRPDFFECRKCEHTFIKTGVPDEFDFDGLED